MILIRSFLLAFSMFSRLPVPTLKWHERNMRYMLMMFPFVGVVVGLVIWVWLLISEMLGFGVILRAAGLTLLPIAVTGGIHLDGFCDTVDALASRAPAERKREILKDPNAGAFAVIGAISYLLAAFAFASELTVKPETPLLLGLIFVISRTLSGLSILLFKSNPDKGTASAFRASADQTISAIALFVFFAAAAFALVWIGILTGAVMIGAALICFLILFITARYQFGGMSGDLAGFFLQLCEVCMLASIVIIDKVVLL